MPERKRGDRKRTDGKKLDRPKGARNRADGKKLDRPKGARNRADSTKPQGGRKMERAEEDERNVNVDSKPGSDSKSGLLEPLITRRDVPGDVSPDSDPRKKKK